MDTRHLALFLTALLVGASLSARMIRISDEDHYNKEVLNSGPVLVEFSADWCSVCNSIKRPIEEIADEDEFSSITFAQVDVDKLDTISKRNGVVGVPTFMYMENGKKKVEEIGVQSMPTFKDHLRGNLRKTFQVAHKDHADQGHSLCSHDAAACNASADTMQEEASAPAAQSSFFASLIQTIIGIVAAILAQIQSFFGMIRDTVMGFFGR